MEYFKSRVKKEWLDLESDSDDENGRDMDQVDENNNVGQEYIVVEEQNIL